MSVGSLTTTFSPPTACATSYSQAYLSNSDAYLYAAQGPISTNVCFPPNYGDSRTQFYSPGICPSGFTSACGSINSIGTVHETVVTCCPTSYTCNNSPVWGWETTMGCSSQIDTLTTTLTQYSNGQPTTSFLTTMTGHGMNAYSVQIRFQSTDFASSTTAPSSTSTVASSTALLTESATTGSSPSSGAISPGATAGIVIGSVAGVLLIAGVIWRVYVFRRNKLTAAQNQELQESKQPALAGSYAEGSGYPQQYYSEQHPAELSGRTQFSPHELDS